MNTSVLNKKKYYSISEVCRQTGLEAHILRYWESEFGQLRPKKNRAGNRAYRLKDIELISRIKHLLYEEKFTIQGARKRLAATHSHAPAQAHTHNGEERHPGENRAQKNGNFNREIARELRSVLKLLRTEGN
jgi:DNA-binding transcriptional MerR regulator